MSKSQSDVNVFATDTILATLMCCTRSAYSWDIVVQKIGGKVFLDKRDNTEFGKIYTNFVKVPTKILIVPMYRRPVCALTPATKLADESTLVRGYELDR